MLASADVCRAADHTDANNARIHIAFQPDPLYRGKIFLHTCGIISPTATPGFGPARRIEVKSYMHTESLTPTIIPRFSLARRIA
jgi:hypothetical protein